MTGCSGKLQLLFCSQCASMLRQAQLCPSCLSMPSVCGGGIADSVADFKSPRSGSWLSETPSSNIGGALAGTSDLSPLDSSFLSVWDPFSPKTIIKQELQRPMIQAASAPTVDSKLFSSAQLSDTSAAMQPQHHPLLDATALVFQGEGAAGATVAAAAAAA
ncbi:unnamed protein product, partial [Gongylonema pulchrum]|uniref:Dof-type domain-containing protein n=1 Tax=Gongylonema pulchrum TaxID=637853 RepID=A0A183DBR9_9BILA